MEAAKEICWLNFRRAGSLSLLLLFLVLVLGGLSSVSSALNSSPDKFRQPEHTFIQEARTLQFHLPQYLLKTSPDLESERENIPVVRQIALYSQSVSLVLSGPGVLPYTFFPDLRETLHSLLFPYHHFW